MPEKSDEEIALNVQQGDIQSFGILVQRYEAKMMQYAKRFLFGYEDAQDLVQEVFLKAYANMQSFDTKRTFSSWLYRIAHNEFINAIKKKGKEPLPFFDPDTLFPHPFSLDSPDRDYDGRELKQMLEAGLNQLDVKYREPLVLYYFEDMNYQKISEILQIPISTVGIRLKRGKAALGKIYRSLHHE